MLQKVLKDTGGASTDYQHVIIELPEIVFRQLDQWPFVAWLSSARSVA